MDDAAGRTLVSMSTLDSRVRGATDAATKSRKAEMVGTLLAGEAVERGIKEVVFDRGGYKYHGRVKALAEGARKAGLEF